jgi:hypothetical protein
MAAVGPKVRVRRTDGPVATVANVLFLEHPRPSRTCDAWPLLCEIIEEALGPWASSRS